VAGTVTKNEMAAIEKVLKMAGGIPLKFTDRTFAHFFADFDVEIDKLYPARSKANRLRDFLHDAEPALAARVLEALFVEYEAIVSELPDEREPPAVVAKYKAIVARLRGTHVDNVGAVTTDLLSLEYVRELEDKTGKRLNEGDHDGAITTARTMLEALLTELHLRIAGVRDDHKGDLPALYKAVSKSLGMDTGRKDLGENFKKVVQGLITIVQGVSEVRNAASDAHAREHKPAAHHAKVVVNAVKTVATFLIESYLWQREWGRLGGAEAKK